MTERIRIRLYNVHFGDAILVSIPDADDGGGPLTRHLLIDVGNVLATAGGGDDVFAPVLEDIKAEVGARGVDLYVMTHEHLDHVQGLLFGATRAEPLTFAVDTVWLTASTASDYYDRFPDAKTKLADTHAVLAAIEHHLAASPADMADGALTTLLANNNPNNTSHCVAHLREKLTSADKVHFVHRSFVTTGKHPFRRASFEILAPEEDTSDYYGRFKPMALGADAGLAVARTGQVVPPSGVDAMSFFNLVEIRSSGATSNALAIDRATNNTSVVFTIRWEGRNLLFAGDAETKSWKTMDRECQLEPVDFLKVSHHGSHNGTPAPAILDRILPPDRPPNERAVAAVSTCIDTYNDVPDDPTIDILRQRCSDVVSTDGGPLFHDIFIEAP
jgi:beta-lactamase superfamily II metal-dependent hydrolase